MKQQGFLAPPDLTERDGDDSSTIWFGGGEPLGERVQSVDRAKEGNDVSTVPRAHFRHKQSGQEVRDHAMVSTLFNRFHSIFVSRSEGETPLELVGKVRPDSGCPG